MKVQSIANLTNVFSLGLCKGNAVPKHYLEVEADNRKSIKIDGETAELLRNPDRTIYTIVKLNENFFYTAKSEIFNEDELKTFVKPEKVIVEKKKKVKVETIDEAETEVEQTTEFDKTKRYLLGEDSFSGHTLLKKHGKAEVNRMLEAGEINQQVEEKAETVTA